MIFQICLSLFLNREILNEVRNLKLTPCRSVVNGFHFSLWSPSVARQFLFVLLSLSGVKLLHVVITFYIIGIFFRTQRVMEFLEISFSLKIWHWLTIYIFLCGSRGKNVWYHLTLISSDITLLCLWFSFGCQCQHEFASLLTKILIFICCSVSVSASQCETTWSRAQIA